MRSGVLIVCLIAGCGRFGFDEIGGTGDGQLGDGVVPGDGQTPSDVAPLGACGQTTVLFDDFTSAAPNSAWTVLQGTNLTATQTAGLLRITFGSNVPAGQSAGYVLTLAMDFTNSCIVVELLTVPNLTASGYALVRIGTPTDNVVFEELQGQLNSRYQNGALVVRLDSRGYDGGLQRFLRLRNVGVGRWFWELSPDGTNYTTIGSSTNSDMPLTNVLRIVAGTGSAVSGGGLAEFGSVLVVR